MNLDSNTACVRMTVHSEDVCPQWREAFRKDGWRTFGRHEGPTGMNTWLAKREGSVFRFAQSDYGQLPQAIELPTGDAREITELMVRTGLAVPS